MRYDSYCGLYCGACEVINARTDADKERVIQIFEKNIPDWQATPEEMHCSGCKSEDVFVNCAKCPIRSCAQGRRVEFCHECCEYPCMIHTYFKMGAVQIPVLKHIAILERNQAFIKRQGVQKWLEDQEKKWKCPQCGNPFSWYSEQCCDCGRSFLGSKDYEQF